MKHLTLFLCGLWLSGCGGCSTDVKPPGDELMGNYLFHAEGTSKVCGLPDIVASSDFGATVSRFRDGGAVFLTLNGAVYDAGFDGQIVLSINTRSADYTLVDGGSCAACNMKVTETFVVALLSKSQSAKLGEMCPPNPLDGGVPPEDDAGVTLPGTTWSDAGSPTGFDAVRACGELLENIGGTAFNCDPVCNSCVLTYRLTGQRQ